MCIQAEMEDVCVILIAKENKVGQINVSGKLLKVLILYRRLVCFLFCIVFFCFFKFVFVCYFCITFS
jgi:hypothetical protein